jgi:hypothetical protein
LFAGNRWHGCDAAGLEEVYFEHVWDLDVGHVGVVEVDLDHDLEFAPAYLLDLVGRFVQF